MATQHLVDQTGQASIQSPFLKQFGWISGILAAVFGLLYSVSFVFIKDNLWNGLFLLISGLLAGLVLVTLYQEVKAADSGLALVGLVLTLVGTSGAVIHGGYDLALGINPVPALPAGVADLPSAIDPRGLLTFGIAGLGIFTFAWLMRQSGRFPAGLIYLGWALAVLMEILYFGRLIILDAKNPLIVVPALLAGFIINPAWYSWLGWRLKGK
jgi:hypothetical protein